jgi:Ser/Thr protein kinase RdoA (MazF antagonist)
MANRSNPKPMNDLLDSQIIAAFVTEHYSLMPPITGSFIERGFNDHYLITTGDRRYIFRVYLNGKYYTPSFQNFQFELDLLQFVHAQGVPVAAPIPSRQGSTLLTIPTKSGLRAVALFSFAEGTEIPEETDMTVSQSFQYGKAIAAFHQCSDDFRSESSRYHLNLEYLVERPLQWINDYGSPEDKAEIESLTPIGELVAQLNALDKKPGTYGIIHGDLHPGNVHFTETDQITLFDFDHCAFGWRAHDLFMLAELPAPQQEAVLKGYESVRLLTLAERQSIQLFGELRIIWDIGDYLAVSALRTTA